MLFDESTRVCFLCLCVYQERGQKCAGGGFIIIAYVKIEQQHTSAFDSRSSVTTSYPDKPRALCFGAFSPATSAFMSTGRLEGRSAILRSNKTVCDEKHEQAATKSDYDSARASLRFDRPTYDTVMPMRHLPRIAPSPLTFREKCGTSAIPSPPSFLVVGVL